MTLKAILLVLVAACTVGITSQEYFARYPVLRNVVIRDASLAGVDAVNVRVTEARSSASYAAITWSSAQKGGLFVYRFKGTQNLFPPNAAEWEILSKYDRIPDPCSLRSFGMRAIDAFRILGDYGGDDLCEPTVITPDIHAVFERSLAKAGWKREEVMHKQIMIAGDYALIEMTQNGWPAHGGFYSQGFVRSGGGWTGAPFTDDVCSMSRAHVPWSVASVFIESSAEISGTVEEDEETLHGGHCASNYDPKLRKI